MLLLVSKTQSETVIRRHFITSLSNYSLALWRWLGLEGREVEVDGGVGGSRPQLGSGLPRQPPPMERFSALSLVLNWINSQSTLAEMLAGSWSRKHQSFLWNRVINSSFISGDHFITDKQVNTQHVICSHAGALSEVFMTLQINIRGREKSLNLLFTYPYCCTMNERICTDLYVPFIF